MSKSLSRGLLGLSCLLLIACRDSPTEPTQLQPASGLVAITITQPCSLPGTLEFFLQGGPSAQVATPGETKISAPPGHYAFFFRRGNEVFGRAGAAGFLDVASGSITALTDPPEACIAAPHSP